MRLPCCQKLSEVLMSDNHTNSGIPDRIPVVLHLAPNLHPDARHGIHGNAGLHLVARVSWGVAWLGMTMEEDMDTYAARPEGPRTPKAWWLPGFLGSITTAIAVLVLDFSLATAQDAGRVALLIGKVITT